MKPGNKKDRIRPISIGKAIVIYVLCAVMIIGMLVGNHFADIYRDLITVYFSGSGTVVTENAERVCLEIEQEGMVLLKNEAALPLAKNARITVLGQDSVDFVYGGAGSGSVDTSKAATLKDALEKEGFAINPTLWDFYTNGAGKSYRKTVPDETGKGEFAINEVPANVYTDKEKNSFSEYSDAAVVCIGRSGGESADIPTLPLASGKRYLELDDNELDLLQMACENFENVIVLLNANNALELGFLEEEAYSNVKGCLWVGGVGQEGIHAVAQALSGTVNPSGHLVDTYAYDSLSAPSSMNFGDYDITNSTVGNGNKYLVYAENIYIGYRYYETRYEDVVLKQGNAGDFDYAKTVQFPFGYGLSYTEFQWSDFDVDAKEDEFEVEVEVKNTGSVAGKDVVEVYLQSPYTDYDRENGIEKAAVELVGFAKTKLLQPGESDKVKISVSKEQMKAYDAEGMGTYIVDAGDYYLTAASDAHEALNHILASKGCTLADGMTAAGNSEFAYKYNVSEMDSETWMTSAATGNQISNQFEDADVREYDGSFQYLSRNNWQDTYPTTYMDGKWEAPNAMLKNLLWNRGMDVVGTGSEQMPEFGKEGHKKVSELAGKDYDEDDWNELIQQLTPEQAMRLVRLGGYATIQLDAIELPATQDKDGPSGISGTLVGGQSAMSYPVEVVMASTWNVDLMEALGESIGDDSVATEVAGWYAPGVNIHRSPYSGRNFEYFSEDGFLSGMMGGHEVIGTRSKGVMTYMKHFALNDQETNRYGAAVFANEQAIREIFLKGFEYTVRIGDSNGAMASMNRIGTSWSGAHKGLMTNVLRNEWGFEGAVITDQASVPAMFYQDIISGLAAGTDLWLNTNKTYWDLSKYAELDGTVTDWTTNAAVMQNVARAAKNIVYMVSTSHAMSNAGAKTHKAPWEIALTILNILMYGTAFLLLIWNTLRLRKTLLAMPKKETTEGDDIMKKPLVALVTIVALILGLAAGFFGSRLAGGKSSGGAAAEIVRTSVMGEIAGNTMNDNDYCEYELTLYSDNTYKFTTTRASNGYSMLLSNTITTAYGTYTMGTSADGSTPCELSEASRILYNGYSDVGGYNMNYDTAVVQFPIELPGGVMTEQADFWALYGAAKTIMLDDANPTRMSFETGSLPPVSKEEAPAEETPAEEAPAEEAPVEETPTEGAPAEEAPAEEAPVEGVVITSDDGATTMTFGQDGRYRFYFEGYSLEDIGTYTYTDGKLLVTNANGLEMTAEGDPMQLHYVASQSDQLTGDFTIEASALN